MVDISYNIRSLAMLSSLAAKYNIKSLAMLSSLAAKYNIRSLAMLSSLAAKSGPKLLNMLGGTAGVIKFWGPWVPPPISSLFWGPLCEIRDPIEHTHAFRAATQLLSNYSAFIERFMRSFRAYFI